MLLPKQADYSIYSILVMRIADGLVQIILFILGKMKVERSNLFRFLWHILHRYKLYLAIEVAWGVVLEKAMCIGLESFPFVLYDKKRVCKHCVERVLI